MTIAVDFDGTLCENAWPDIGEPHEEVIRRLKRRQQNGDKIILWTCRQGAALMAAVQWCLKQGLRFDAVNENLPEYIEEFGGDCRKLWAHEYWDDKNIIVKGDGVLWVNYYGENRTSVHFAGKEPPTNLL